MKNRARPPSTSRQLKSYAWAAARSSSSSPEHKTKIKFHKFFFYKISRLIKNMFIKKWLSKINCDIHSPNHTQTKQRCVREKTGHRKTENRLENKQSKAYPVWLSLFIFWHLRSHPLILLQNIEFNLLSSRKTEEEPLGASHFPAFFILAPVMLLVQLLQLVVPSSGSAPLHSAWANRRNRASDSYNRLKKAMVYL